MRTKIIVTGKHTEENIQRFKELPGAQIVFVPTLDDVSPADWADTQILVGGVNKTLAENKNNTEITPV